MLALKIRQIQAHLSSAFDGLILYYYIKNTAVKQVFFG